MQVRELTQENARLRERVPDLEARLGMNGMNSSNSSKPPSSDPPQAKRGARGQRSKRGARQGPPGVGRDLLPQERVDEVLECRAEQCRRCGLSLADAPAVGEPGRWQVIELPLVRAHVTEHRTLCCVCPACGTRSRGQLPEAVRRSHFGARLVAFGAMLTSRFRLSRAWGAWWVWEPRLTLTLLLWFIYLGYFILRGATESPERGKRFAAILGIVGAVDIPLIHVSVNWFRSQHPQPVILRPEGPTAAPEIVQTLLVSLLAFTLLFFALLLFRYGLEVLRQREEALKVRAETGRTLNPTEGVLR
jgi:hypothetical protein